LKVYIVANSPIRVPRDDLVVRDGHLTVPEERRPHCLMTYGYIGRFKATRDWNSICDWHARKEAREARREAFGLA
jgi:hypothetical protein